MSSTSSPGGPLTEWCKHAGVLSTGAEVAGQGLGLLGKGVWRAAGTVAPNPVARTGLLAATGVGIGTQVPQLAGRVSQDARFVRGEGPSVRGF